MLLGWLRRYKLSGWTVPAVMQYLNIPKHKRQRDSKYCILRKEFIHKRPQLLEFALLYLLRWKMIQQ